MREPWPGQGSGASYLVLNRSCADLYDEIAELFAERLSIEVMEDRRRGRGRMARIPARQRGLARTRRGQANPRLASVRLRKEVI